MVNQAVLSKDNPVADVMFGIDNTFLGRALEARPVRQEYHVTPTLNRPGRRPPTR